MSDDQSRDAVEQRAELAAEILDGLDDGRHYTGLGYVEIDGETSIIEVVWNHEPDHGGVGYPRDGFTDREESERHRQLAAEKVGEPTADEPPTKQTQLATDDGLDSDARAGVPVDELAWLLVATGVATALIIISQVTV